MFYKVFLLKDEKLCSVNAIKALNEEEAFEIARWRLARTCNSSNDSKGIEETANKIQLKEVVFLFE